MINPFDRQLPLWPHLASTTTGRIVYFLACRAFVKIGYTSREVHARIPELQTGNPDKLELIGTLVIRDDDDDRDLHAQLRRFHYRGEWFHKTDELLAIIADLLSGPEIHSDLVINNGGQFIPDVDCPYCGEWLGLCLNVPVVPTDPEIVRATITHPRIRCDGTCERLRAVVGSDCFRGCDGFHGCGRRFRLVVHIKKATPEQVMVYGL